MKIREDLKPIITNVEYLHDNNELMTAYVRVEIGGLHVVLNYEVDRYLDQSDYEYILNLVIEDEFAAMLEHDVYILDYREDIITFGTTNDYSIIELCRVTDFREDENETLKDYCKRVLENFVETNIGICNLQRINDERNLFINGFNDIENKLDAVTKVRSKFEYKLVEFTAEEIYKGLVKTIRKYS